MVSGRRSYFVRSPHRHAPTAFLKYLLENDCVSKEGLEYNKDDVEALYQERIQREADALYKKQMLEAQRYFSK